MERLDELRKVAEKYKVLRSDFVKNVSHFCTLIANCCDGVAVFVDKRLLWVEAFTTRFGEEKFLMIYRDVPRALASFAPGGVVYLHDDCDVKLHIATIEDFRWVAERTQQIVDAFLEKIKRESTKLRCGLEIYKESIQSL